MLLFATLACLHVLDRKYQYDPEVTGMCLDTSGSPAADPDTSAIPSCASTQPSDFSGIVDGEFTFSNYALIAPKQASTSNPLLLSFSSPGLIGASFGLELRPGVAVKLELVLPEQFRRRSNQISLPQYQVPQAQLLFRFLMMVVHDGSFDTTQEK